MHHLGHQGKLRLLTDALDSQTWTCACLLKQRACLLPLPSHMLQLCTYEAAGAPGQQAEL